MPHRPVLTYDFLSFNHLWPQSWHLIYRPYFFVPAQYFFSSSPHIHCLTDVATSICPSSRDINDITSICQCFTIHYDFTPNCQCSTIHYDSRHCLVHHQFPIIVQDNMDTNNTRSLKLNLFSCSIASLSYLQCSISHGWLPILKCRSFLALRKDCIPLLSLMQTR